MNAALTKKQNKAVVILGTLFVLLFLAFLVSFFPLEKYSIFYPKCVLYELTGIYCPGCGNTRAFSSLVHGNFLASLSYNILLIPTIVLLLALLIRPKLAFKPAVPITILVIVLAFFVLRNLPWYPFSLLAPHDSNHSQTSQTSYAMNILQLNPNQQKKDSVLETEQWGIVELTLPASSLKQQWKGLQVTFSSEQETHTIAGFQKNDSEFAVRFMPAFCGKYTCHVESETTAPIKDVAFTATKPSDNNHGPVRVAPHEHFAYADGTPCYPVGTTSYAWIHQPEAVRKDTIESLKLGYFNKIRFCVFPKFYVYNQTDPEIYPFLRKENSTEKYDWDYTRPNPVFFERFDKAMLTLCELGIEADIILFHPYDRWGFSKMPPEANDAYLKYMVSRYAAFRNVWWSLANEYDFMKEKNSADWKHYGELIRDCDFANHLRSVHNGNKIYDFKEDWVTHCSIQNQDRYQCGTQTDSWRRQYQKPTALDEIAYEGTIPYVWGCITAQEMVDRCWEVAIRGGYPTHGETYVLDDGIIWWSHGGKLHGQSGPRLAFLRNILKQTPGNGLKKIKMDWDDNVCCAEDDPNYMIFYFGNFRPCIRPFNRLDSNASYHVEIIDVWNMTIEDKGILKGRFELKMPGREFIAVRVVKVQE